MVASIKVLTPTRMRETFGSVKMALEKIDSEVRLHHYKIRNFEPHVRFQFERGHYIVKTAENGAELEQCLKLRFEVFHREYKNKKRTIGVDIDRLDDICDHLVIFDKRSQRVVGTYRLNSSLFNDTFYSQSEFHMDELLKESGNKLELGRACIDRDHRNGVIIALLWRGIAEYIQRTETKILFGCGSIKTMEPLEIGLLTKYMESEGLMHLAANVEPTRKYKVKQLNRVLDYIERNPYEYDKDDVEKRIPALFYSYLKAGAKVCGEPALDRDFHCIDFLIYLKIDEMSPLMKGKYKV